MSINWKKMWGGVFADCEFARREQAGAWVDVWQRSKYELIVNWIKIHSPTSNLISYFDITSNSFEGRIYGAKNTFSASFGLNPSTDITSVSLSYTLQGTGLAGSSQYSALSMVSMNIFTYDKNNNYNQRVIYRNEQTNDRNASGNPVLDYTYNGPHRFAGFTVIISLYNGHNSVQFNIRDLKVNGVPIKLIPVHYEGTIVGE